MKKLCYADKYNVLLRVDSVFDAITKRLLPAFSTIVQEADRVEKNRLMELSKRFNPETMDEANVYDDAYHEGVNHYLLQNELKNEFLKSSVTWLFHLFEKSCSDIFETENGNDKKRALKQLGISTSPNSEWHKCNSEMRLVANAIKHGPGQSMTKLRNVRPDLFKSNIAFISDNAIEISENELVLYKNAMEKFWNEFFEKAEY